MDNKSKKNEVQINEEIRASILTVIDKDNNRSLMKKEDALDYARSLDLDLVLVALQKKPDGKTEAIAKVMDYGKHKFEQTKKAKEAKKKQHNAKSKEIKVRPLIGDHDLEVRANNAIRWLNDGDRVNFIIEARGRVSIRTDIIYGTYNKFIEMIGSAGVVSKELKKSTNTRYETIIIPNKK